MRSSSFTKIITADSSSSSSTYDLPSVSSSDFDFKMESRNVSASPSSSLNSSLHTIPSMESMFISEPVTPIPSTPVNESRVSRPPFKNVHSLDLEMRSKKRRRSCESGDYYVCSTPPSKSLGLPSLMPLEDDTDGENCLPDTSFLRQKKPLRRRRIIV